MRRTDKDITDFNPRDIRAYQYELEFMRFVNGFPEEKRKQIFVFIKESRLRAARLIAKNQHAFLTSDEYFVITRKVREAGVKRYAELTRAIEAQFLGVEVAELRDMLYKIELVLEGTDETAKEYVRGHLKSLLEHE